MTTALVLHDVHKSFGSTKIINGVSLEVRAGERHAIIGPNGAGKSTLYNLVSGRFPVSSGKIVLYGEEITGLKPYEINRKGLSRSFQVTNIFHNMSVYENIRCAVLWPAGYRYSFWSRVGGLKDVQRRAEETMERIGLARRRDVLAGVLTYAEQLIRDVTVGKTLIMVEHDMGVIFDLADRISVLVYGEIIATGAPADIRSNAAVQEAYLGSFKKE